MPDCLLLVLAASLALTAWAYARAFRIHNLIEAQHPGFNEKMRSACALMKRIGLKK